MKRVFIAVKVHAEGDLLRMISSLKASLGTENIKWVDTSNIHLTLAFLGDTEEKRIKILSGMLNEKCTGFNDFEFLLAGTGVFKNYRDPRIIWIGIESAERLLALNTVIAEGLKFAGFKTEEREFKPHLTIGRIKTIKDAENLKTVLERYKDRQIQTVNVGEVILYESILMQTGPLYKPLGKYPL
jgi:2'-5' RNA ligase